MFQTTDVAGVTCLARISPSIPIVCSKRGAHEQQLSALQIHATHLHPQFPHMFQPTLKYDLITNGTCLSTDDTSHTQVEQFGTVDNV
jgi:hypothetical protein